MWKNTNEVSNIKLKMEYGNILLDVTLAFGGVELRNIGIRNQHVVPN